MCLFLNSEHVSKWICSSRDEGQAAWDKSPTAKHSPLPVLLCPQHGLPFTSSSQHLLQPIDIPSRCAHGKALMFQSSCFHRAQLPALPYPPPAAWNDLPTRDKPFSCPAKATELLPQPHWGGKSGSQASLQWESWRGNCFWSLQIICLAIQGKFRFTFCRVHFMFVIINFTTISSNVVKCGIVLNQKFCRYQGWNTKMKASWGQAEERGWNLASSLQDFTFTK